MFNLNLFKNIGFLLYLFVYLIIPYSAITQTLKVDFIRNLETSLNSQDLEFIRKNFRNEESQNIPKQFAKIINDFPNSKWKIKRLKSKSRLFKEFSRFLIKSTFKVCVVAEW